VWDFTGNAFDEGDAAAAWLEDVLGYPARLVRYGAAVRTASSEFGGEGMEVAFVDGFPVLVANEVCGGAESLA